jgi:quinol monooxygenase YgiN
MIQLIITVTTIPGRVEEYIGAFARIAPQVRLEEGCIQYELYRDSNDPRFDNEVRKDTLIICEKWESIELLQAHSRNSEPLIEFRKAVKDIKLSSSYVLLSPLVRAER